VTAIDAAAGDGPCGVYLDADGSRISRLSAHIRSTTGVRVSEYPAERRAVVHLGERYAESVELFVSAAALARLIDALNATHSRLIAPDGATAGPA
jgi:hypothetical protein